MKTLATIALTAAAIGTAAVVSGAHNAEAAPNPDAAACLRSSGSDGINACTRFLRYGAYTPWGRGWAHYHRGRHYYNLRRYRQAIGDYTRAIANDPGTKTRSVYYSARARSYYHLSRRYIGRGLRDVRLAIQIDPQCKYCWDTQGHLLAAIGRKRQAIDSFRVALGIDPQYRSSREGLRRLGVRS
jgi:tetratricopeptide (TPR) repeat protein